MSFAELGLSPKVLEAVTAAGYSTPTAIQAAAIPVVTAGRDKALIVWKLAEGGPGGRTLKKDQAIERIVVEDAKYTKPLEERLVEDNNLLTEFRQVKSRDKFYRRQQERSNRQANKALGFSVEEEAEGGEEAEPAEDDGENIGKASFSTQRPALLYRRRTAEEEAHYQLRYHQFLRSTIYEYMGVFHDKDIEEASQHRSSLINPQSLRWPTGAPYFTEEEVEDALQFRRNFAQAQQDYEDYIYGSEFLRSSGTHVDRLNAERAALRSATLEHLGEVGLVESVRRVGGEGAREKAEVLNAQAAGFGEEWRVEGEGEEQLLVKVRKLESLLPLDRVAHLEQFIAQHGEDVSQQQAALFEKHYSAMRQGGTIPDEVSDAFGV